MKSVLTAKLLTRKRKRYWRDIRDQAYLLVYKHWRIINELIEKHADIEIVNDIDGRPLELWYSIFVLAELFEDNGCTDLQHTMYDMAKQYVKDMVALFEMSSEGSMIHALRFLMWDNEPPFEGKYYRFQDVKQYFARQIAFGDEELDEEGRTIQGKVRIPSWLRPSYLFTLLRKLGFKTYDGKGSRKRVYLDKDALVDLWERYIGDWEEPALPVGGKQTTLTAAHAMASNPQKTFATTKNGTSVAEAKGMTMPRQKDVPDRTGQKEKDESVTSDMVCIAMLNKEEWTRESLEKWLVSVCEYDEQEIKNRLDQQIGDDPRIIPVDEGSPDGKIKVTDGYRKMHEKKKPEKKDADEEQDND